MPPNIIELRPDRKLLNSEFEGYKLSLESIPTFKEELTIKVDRVLPNNEQYSILHAKLFGLHNHLIGETINDKEYVYYIDETRSINKVTYDPLTSQLITTRDLWTVPIEERLSGDFNISLKFATNNLAVLADGSGMLYILETGHREDDKKWNQLFCDDVLNNRVPFVLEDCVCILKENDKLILHCLLLSINRDEKSEKFLSILNWVTFSREEDNSWGQIAIRELQAVGSLYYSQIERSCEAIYVVSDNSFKCTLDSEHPIVEEKEEVIPSKKLYMWKQTGEDLTIHLKLPDNFNKSLLNIAITTRNLIIKYQNDAVLSGELYQAIDNDLSTWTVNNNSLEIILYKSEIGLTWTELIKNNNYGEYLVEEALASEIQEKLAHLCSDTPSTSSGITFVNTQELEECDFEEDNCSMFERMCATTHRATHRIHLNSLKYCLVVKTDDTLPQSIAFTHDVDACIWQPEVTKDDFRMKHVGTLLAFGYVQVSKQQRKFTVCSPDLGYSVICESNRHIFIYRQNKPILDAELRNRTTSRKIGTVAQQQVISLDNTEVLGVYAGNSFLYILNENSIYGLKI